MSDLNYRIERLVEAAKYVVLTGEGIGDLAEALSEYEKFTELAEVVVDSYADDNEVGC